MAGRLSGLLKSSFAKRRLHELGDFLRTLPLPPAPHDTPSAKVEFIHRAPALPNLGDNLCSPKHYYAFEPSRSNVAIVGGGVLGDFGVEFGSSSSHDHRVSWGIGRSIQFHLEQEAPALDRQSIDRLYAASSTRDPEWATNGVRLVPCCSVLHALCDMKPGAGVGIFLNADAEASGPYVRDILDEHKSRRVVTATNAMPEGEFLERFAATGTLITNSYHAAYWGLLSGRTVTVVGYSSKFASLMMLCGLSANAVIKYRRGDGEALCQAVRTALTDSASQLLDDARGLREQFRAMNDAYARDLVRKGLFRSIRHYKT